MAILHLFSLLKHLQSALIANTAMPTRHDDAISGIRHANHAILQFKRALGREVDVHLADVAL
jgi:hypothetical protein